MPNTETVRALVSAFNVHNYARNTVKTNFTLQSDGKKDYIVVSFDKSMDTYQCSRYLDSIKRKIIREFYGIEESNDAEILDTAKLIFDVNSFPFDISDRDWSWDKQHGFKFVTPVDEGVIFNLKSHLAFSLKKDVQEDMLTYINSQPFDKKKYLWHGEFDNKGLRKKFESMFLSRMKARYENVPKNPLKVEGNDVYIKDVFNDACFIDSVTRRVAWLIGRDLQADSKSRSDVKAFKDLMMEILDPSTRVITSAFLCVSPLNREETSILIPVILSNRGTRFLTKEEARDINHKFNNPVLDDISDKTQATFKVNGSNVLYGIDFSNKEISHCVITKIIESSVINKDHELSIDPERVLSPAQSPVRVPNGPSSSLTGLLPPTQGSPTCGREELKAPPRQGSEKEGEELLLYSLGQVNSAGTSIGPSTQMNSIAVSYGISAPSSSHSASAAQNVQVGPSAWAQQTNPWSSPPPAHENKWASSLPFTKQGPSGLSWKGASERRTSDKPLTEKEKELIEALLYTLNLTNYTFDGVHTNFFAKGEKIVSLLHDNVDRKKYLQAVIGYIIEEYCEDEEEARKIYDFDEFPFKLDYEEKQGKTVVANISSGALSNLKILFSQKFGKNVDAIDISVVKEVEKHEKEEWVGLQLKSCTFTTEEDIKKGVKQAYTSCFPDERPMKIIPIASEGDGYVLDRSRDRSEVRLLRKALPPLTTKEGVQRFLDCVFKTGKTQQELSQEEKELFKALLYAFNYSNNNFDRPDTNFIVKNGKIVSLINDNVDVKEYLKEVRGETIKEYCVNEKEAYDLNEFPFKFLSNCEKNQETTVVANISRGALLNLEKLFIYGYKVKIEKIDINIVEEAVKSKKHKLVELKEKGIEREAGYRTRIKHCEAVTASYPDESALEDIPIRKYEAGYRLGRGFDDWETELTSEELRRAKGTSVAKKGKLEDNKDSGISSGEATDAENVSSKAEATTSGYESMDCENTRGGSPKHKSPSPEDGGSSRKSPKREPCSNLSDPKLCEEFYKVGISK